jgi:GNAT superfamily N-acetyltransferase
VTDPSSPPIAIRPAAEDDAGAVGRLVAEFQVYLRELGDATEFGFDAAAYRRDGFGGDPAFQGFVAEEEDGTISGYVLYHLGYDTDRGRRVVHVIDLYVRESSRRRGIGEALMRSVAEVGRERGACALLWVVFRPNVLALRFYEGIGARIADDLHLMVLDL